MSLLKRIEQGQGSSNTPQPPASGSASREDQASKLAELRAKRVAPPTAGGAPSSAGGATPHADLKTRVQNRLLSELDHSSLDISHTAEVRKTVEDLYENILAEDGIVLSRA